MGALLVLMLIGLIGGVVWKIKNRREAPPPVTRMIELGLPSGTTVGQMVLDGDRLALNTGEEIVVVDVKSGAVVARIRLK